MLLVPSVLSLLLASHSALAAQYLDPTDTKSLKNATAQALQNLFSYYVPSSSGVFNENTTPWHQSGMIWGQYMDYLKWSGDAQFHSRVAGALSNMSYTDEQDFLHSKYATLQETLEGKWNDDILWPAQAVIAGAEVFGADSIQYGAAGGKWITLAQRTFDEAYQQWDSGCGGGIYWSRNRHGSSANYKSTITNLEFAQQGARIYLQTKNQTALTLAEQTMDWVLTGSGLVVQEQGQLFDGLNVGACGTITRDEWSYNYGELIGAMAWLHKATGNSSYLSLAAPYVTRAIAIYGPNGVIAELCEADNSCGRDQYGFKAILTRNLVYYYRETSDSSMKQSIQKIIDSTLNAMVTKSCDSSWNCGGNWTVNTAPAQNVISQTVSSALFVSALGIHSTATGSGLLTNIDQAGLNGTAVAKNTTNAGLGAVSQLEGARSTLTLALLLVVGILAVVF
ncbi:family 76 glycoside hydrolase [Meredithblackwellia eburnea MCA 4105]